MNLNKVVGQNEQNNTEESVPIAKPGHDVTASLPSALQTASEVLNVIVEIALMGIMEGFLPHVERQRREATDVRKNYIDLIFNFLGAVVGRQQCSEILACR